MVWLGLVWFGAVVGHFGAVSQTVRAVTAHFGAVPQTIRAVTACFGAVPQTIRAAASQRPSHSIQKKVSHAKNACDTF
ncbi:hypothetical protein CSV79_08155 [Sporosarcina sp. P13]|uniref:hypothetical protein n=1 Tax=Sporosarcina sp. P13 TaxID=2048263 RepID=UPI000C16773B|nr:hypothetical protein [Sporosarcina sp. P13]PIC64152.1 hypothetical protein CSV79_08155 [Sporosarcina sp. P13]